MLRRMLTAAALLALGAAGLAFRIRAQGQPACVAAGSEGAAVVMLTCEPRGDGFRILRYVRSPNASELMPAIDGSCVAALEQLLGAGFVLRDTRMGNQDAFTLIRKGHPPSGKPGDSTRNPSGENR